MPPFNLPMLTFGAFLVLSATILLALLWALWDRARERFVDARGMPPDETPGKTPEETGRSGS